MLNGLFGNRGDGPDGARLSYSSDGRSGHVHYQSAAASFSMYYEFGGGDCVASIDLPSASDWPRLTGMPLDRRAEVLDWIGRRVVQDQARGGRFTIERDWLLIHSK